MRTRPKIKTRIMRSLKRKKVKDETPTTRSADMEVFASRVREEAARLAPHVPQIAMHDLLLIVSRRLRPWGSGQKMFIRRSPEGHYVF